MAAAAATPLPSPEGVVDRLLAAAAELADRDLDGRPDGQLGADLETLEQVRRRVEAHQIALADILKTRRTRRLRERGTDADKAARQAERATQDELTDTLQWSRSDARRATRLGRELHAAGTSDGTRDAFSAGHLPPRHAKLLADTLRHLVGAERDWAEAVLLEAARREDAVTFGRTCRRLLAELDHEAAMADEDRRHARRGARMTQTDDGMLALSAHLSGIDAETVATAIHAFRRPDPPDVRRSPEQATADAIVDLAAAALRAAEAPAHHGIRPHATVDLDYRTLLAQAGVTDAVWMGPLPFGEARRLLADCGVSRLLVEPDSTPVEAGPETRNVPNGLYRGLLRRDGGCIAVGCDAPAAWCDAMHLDHPYRFEGRLSLHNAALGCRLHHRKYDRANWKITWIDGRPVLHPPGRPPGKPAGTHPEPAGRARPAPPTGGDARPGRKASHPPGNHPGAGPGPSGGDPTVAPAATDTSHPSGNHSKAPPGPRGSHPPGPPGTDHRDTPGNDPPGRGRPTPHRSTPHPHESHVGRLFRRP